MTEEGSPSETLDKPSLVGQCPEVELTIHGVKIPCVLDTGSQVTLFSYSLFQRCVAPELLQDPDRIPWLTLKAANGLRIPYIGYAVLDFAVGGIEVKDKGIVIVKDSCMGTEYGLLGMNVIKDCWEKLFLNGHPGEMAFKSICHMQEDPGPRRAPSSKGKADSAEPHLHPPTHGDDRLD